MKKREIIFGVIGFLAVCVIVMNSFINPVYSQSTSQNPDLLDVSKWTAKNWQEIASMDAGERDTVWQKASASDRNNAIKELGSKEGKTIGGFLGFGRTKEEGITIETAKGFEDSSLKWYVKDKTKIIGDGTTFLDLDSIPKGVIGLEYKDGQFVLTKKDGSKIIIDKGATDENGKLRAFRYDDIKKSKGLNDLEIKAGKDGEIILTENGFRLRGDGTQVKIGDMTFERKAGEKSEESIVEIGKDRFILQGIEFKKDNWVITKPTDYKFIVNFGSSENLADYVAFKDVDGKWTYVRFDQSGKINGIARDSVNNGNWVPISSGLKGTYLEEIYHSSGATIKRVIEDAQKSYNDRAQITGLDYLKKQFYADSQLKAYAQEISVETLQPNFLSINGLSFEIGGKGEIEVLRELTGITAIDSSNNPINFKTKIGDININFDSQGIHYPTAPVKNSFKIDDITMIKDGKVFGDSFALTGNSAGDKIVSKSRYFVAGRETRLGEMGVSTDIHLDIANEYLDKVREKIESKGSGGYYSDYLAQVMKESEYAVEVDLYVPPSLVKDATKGIIDPTKGEVTLTGTQIGLLANTIILPNLEKKLNELSLPVEGEDMKLRTETISVIKDIVATTLANTNEVKLGGNSDTGRFTIGFQNNPDKTPSLLLGLPGGEIKNIPLKDTPTSQTATFVQNMLEASVRAPVSERGEIGTYSWSTRAWLAGKYSANQYWPRDYLRRLWYQNLGKGYEEWGRLMSPSSGAFFRGENGVINTYLQKK